MTVDRIGRKEPLRRCEEANFLIMGGERIISWVAEHGRGSRSVGFQGRPPASVDDVSKLDPMGTCRSGCAIANRRLIMILGVSHKDFRKKLGG